MPKRNTQNSQHTQAHSNALCQFLCTGLLHAPLRSAVPFPLAAAHTNHLSLLPSPLLAMYNNHPTTLLLLQLLSHAPQLASLWQDTAQCPLCYPALCTLMLVKISNTQAPQLLFIPLHSSPPCPTHHPSLILQQTATQSVVLSLHSLAASQAAPAVLTSVVAHRYR